MATRRPAQGAASHASPSRRTPDDTRHTQVRNTLRNPLFLGLTGWVQDVASALHAVAAGQRDMAQLLQQLLEKREEGTPSSGAAAKGQEPRSTGRGGRTKSVNHDIVRSFMTDVTVREALLVSAREVVANVACVLLCYTTVVLGTCVVNRTHPNRSTTRTEPS